MNYVLNLMNAMVILISFVLICIVLIQRGRGGGLAGAFGGVGGSSAFGTKAGDVFTRVTIGVAVAWILLSMLIVRLTNQSSGGAGNPAFDFGSGSSLSKDLGSSSKTASGVVEGAPPPVSTPTTSSAPPNPGTTGPAGPAAGTGSLGTAAPTVSVPPIPENTTPATKK